MGTPDAITRVFSMPPVDTRYVLGRWHHDRVTARGFLMEARVNLRSLVVPRNDNTRFLIVSRARSGTTLLRTLLNGHSQIHCANEVLKCNVLAPKVLLDRLAAKTAVPVYGAKLLSYQMVQVQRIRDPQRFLGDLAAQGFILVHLERETFSQTLSLAIANRRGWYRDGRLQLDGPVELDPDAFARWVEWSDALLSYEKAALSGLDHVSIRYESDLVEPDRQQETLRRLCERFGVPPEPPDGKLTKKILPKDPRRIVRNYDDIVSVLEARGFGHLIPVAPAHPRSEESAP